MKNPKFFLILFSFMFLSCDSKKNISLEINEVFENYYQESLKLYPLNATRQGNMLYNDFLPNKNEIYQLKSIFIFAIDF